MGEPSTGANETVPSPPPAWHETTLRVRYEETDRMGIVYHGKYFEYFEVGRTEWLRARGHAYRDLEAKGHGLAVVEVHARYRAPARYDDLITVRTRRTALGRASVDFAYEILRDDGILLAEGTTRLASVGPDGRPKRMPPELAEIEGGSGSGATPGGSTT